MQCVVRNVEINGLLTDTHQNWQVCIAQDSLQTAITPIYCGIYGCSFFTERQFVVYRLQCHVYPLSILSIRKVQSQSRGRGANSFGSFSFVFFWAPTCWNDRGWRRPEAFRYPTFPTVSAKPSRSRPLFDRHVFRVSSTKLSPPFRQSSRRASASLVPRSPVSGGHSKSAETAIVVP